MIGDWWFGDSIRPRNNSGAVLIAAPNRRLNIPSWLYLRLGTNPARMGQMVVENNPLVRVPPPPLVWRYSTCTPPPPPPTCPQHPLRAVLNIYTNY